MPQYYTQQCGCQFEVSEAHLIKRGKPMDWYLSNHLVPPIKLDITNVRKDCPEVWRMLGQGLTKGVFQLESQLGKQWTKKLKPTCIEHLCALGALLRPGCLRSIDKQTGFSLTELFCKRKNRELEVEYLHPCLQPVLKETYGVLTYQEQAMQLARIIAGFNLMEADVLRKAIGKKLPEEMAKVEVMFYEGAKKVGLMGEEMYREIFGWIKESQRYSFNKCIHKDTIIKRVAKGRYLKTDGYTVEHMFKIRNDIEYAKSNGQLSLYKKWKLIKSYGKAYSMFEDGRIRPNTIADIKYVGKKQTYKITLDNGSTISTTDNHKFPTPNGIKQLKELAVNNILYVCGKYEMSDFKSMNRFSKEDKILDSKSHDGKTSGFMSGENNPAYTNGSYTDFTESKKTIEKKCNKCGETEGRLEYHHIDKDRTNSKQENIECLCPSCHKKEDYKLGRTKRGEKGYPILEHKILSIEEDSIVDTYDVTMEAPNHNFVVSSDIVTCNSHSLSYAVNGYWSAYSKAHLPTHFFTSWLRHAKEKQDPLMEIRELVNEAKLMDIEVLTPDLRSMKKHFFMDGQKVKFGLADVKGIGEAQIEKLQAAVAAAEQQYGKKIQDLNWWEFLVLVSPNVSTTVVERLTEVGAMSYMDVALPLNKKGQA